MDQEKPKTRYATLLNVLHDTTVMRADKCPVKWDSVDNLLNNLEDINDEEVRDQVRTQFYIIFCKFGKGLLYNLRRNEEKEERE